MPKFSMVPTRNSGRLAACLLAGVFAVSATAADDQAWHMKISEAGRQATVSLDTAGYHFVHNRVEKLIRRQVAFSDTASTVFDGMFALAQSELGEAGVEAIRYKAFNNDKALPCRCLVAGRLWPWVWTRDTAYATDLGLYRFDPRSARNSLEFKISTLRGPSGGPQAAKPRSGQRGSALYVVQDTGSGGSWPVSTDRVSWFLGARHLLDDKAFAGKVYNALTTTLAQDRRYVFDPARGLYRGETSFLDWRQQSYPAWTEHDVVYIAESYALSTNVLYYEALRLAASMAQSRDAAGAKRYRAQAAALKAAIDRQFWREDRGMYMSYVGPADTPQTIEAYDLLGTALVIESGVAPPARARRALANYPTWPDGSPVIWPERRDQPVYHNRAFWPFVSAYALKAARKLDEPSRIAHELRSIVRMVALSGSNMENHELPMPAAEADSSDLEQSGPSAAGGDGKSGSAAQGDSPARAKSVAAGPGKLRRGAHERRHSGPVVNSPRQLWSIAAYLDIVVEGVFGLTDDGKIEPKLPRELVPMLFGDRSQISLKLPHRRITLVMPATLDQQDNLLVAAQVSGPEADTQVQLRGVHVADSPLPLGRPAYAPPTPAPARVERDGDQWRVHGEGTMLYVNGSNAGAFKGESTLPARGEQLCVSLTTRDADGIESLPSKPVCVGDSATVDGDWPRRWTAKHGGHYQLRLDYTNPHGPIMTGITAAVKMLTVRCAGSPARTQTVVMPHSEGMRQSTAVDFDARAGQRCTFSLGDGFNMSYLAHYALYNGGEGGSGGSVNAAKIGVAHIVALP